MKRGKIVTHYNLLLAAVFYPDPEYHYGVMNGAYYPLWGGARGIVCVEHEMDQTPILSNSPIIEGFVRTIFVVSRSWWALRENEVTTRLVIPAGEMIGRATERLDIAFF
jgi:hypothetical protein